MTMVKLGAAAEVDISYLFLDFQFMPNATQIEVPIPVNFSDPELVVWKFAYAMKTFLDKTYTYEQPSPDSGLKGTKLDAEQQTQRIRAIKFNVNLARALNFKDGTVIVQKDADKEARFKAMVVDLWRKWVEDGKTTPVGMLS